MTRLLTLPNGGATFARALILAQGGTGKTTAPAALTALGGIPATLINQPNGPVQLDENGHLALSYLSELSLTDAAVDGDNSILIGETKEFFLTTYDAYQSYDVVALSGSVVRDRNVIRYTAGQTPGMGGFSVNGRAITVIVMGLTVSKPSILVPSNGAKNRPLSSNYISSTFSAVGGTDTHASSDWEVSEDVTFSEVLSRSYDDPVNLTGWSTPNLKELKKHYVRVRYRGASGKVSAWSDTSAFTTGNDDIINTEVQKFTSLDNAAGDFFGSAISVSADGLSALVGSFRSIYRSTNGNLVTGAVYAFAYVNGVWAQQAKFYSPDPTDMEGFGRSIAMNAAGTYAVIGAEGSTVRDAYGCVYLYTKIGNDWIYQSQILPGAEMVTGEFGISCALSGDGLQLLVGTGADNGPGNVYHYTRASQIGAWTLSSIITANDGALADRFGRAVALNQTGTAAIITAMFDDDQGVNSGSAYYFTRSGSVWTQVSKFYSPAPAANNAFGESVSLSPDGMTALLGDTNFGSPNTGAAHFYKRTGNTWNFERTLQSSNHQPGSYFGMGGYFSLTNNFALVCERADSSAVYNGGSVYMFK